jgi:hypothetical protein
VVWFSIVRGNLGGKCFMGLHELDILVVEKNGRGLGKIRREREKVVEMEF